jgi:hypothetical protein
MSEMCDSLDSKCFNLILMYDGPIIEGHELYVDLRRRTKVTCSIVSKYEART